MKYLVETCSKELRFVLTTLKDCKPNDKSEVDRRFAITITELEKVIGYFNTWVVDTLEDEEE